MPLPIIPIIISGVLVASGSVAAYIYWKELKKFFKGKNLIILGTIETGKTTMHNFLRYGEITEIHKATRREQTVKGKNFKLEDLKLKLSKGKDISGQKDFEREWKEMFLAGDICFYLFNSSRIFNNDLSYIETVNNHLKHIGNWKKECELIPDTIVIGTFADQIPLFNELDDSSIQKLDEILRSKIQLSFGKISSSQFFIGDLSNENGIKDLMRDILRYLNSQKK